MRFATRLTVVALALAARSISGQCPDGSPPPCRAQGAVAPPPAAERARRFLVLPFRNLSRGEEQEWLVEGATEMLGESLGHWREITVVSDDRLYPALRRFGATVGTLIAPDRVRLVAEETGGWTAVTGDVVASGGRLRVSVRAYDVASNQELIPRFTVDAPVAEDVRGLFDRVSARLLRSAGLDSAPASITATTTRSLNAYREYLRGVRHLNRAEFRQAHAALAEAVRIDSMFAQAHFLLVEAALFSDPFSLATPGAPLGRSYLRSLALIDHFAPAERELFLGVDAIFSGRLSAAREILGGRVRRDSSDIRAVAWLSFVEYADGVLVSMPGGGERRRGSPNANIALARRTLALDPARHDAFIPMLTQYLVAAGAFPGILVGWRGESRDLLRAVMSAPARIFVPLLLDTIVSVPAESLFTIPPDSIDAARRRALDSAMAVSNRWLAVGPTEGTARHMAAEVAVVAGDLERALAQLHLADSLGSEIGGLDSRVLRMSTLARLGRYDEARIALFAGSAQRHLAINAGMATLLDEGMAAPWAFGLYIMSGDASRAAALLDFRTRALRSMVPDSATARGMALSLLAGDRLPPFLMNELPLSFRMDVLDGAYARPAGADGESSGMMRAAMAQMASRAARRPGGATALADRARASAWYAP